MTGARCLPRGLRDILLRLVLVVPFVVVFIAYDRSRAIASSFHGVISYNLPLELEERIFGLPLALWFQSHRITLVDYATSLLYSIHPTYFLVLLLYLLLCKTRLYVHALVSVTLASTVAVAMYILWPLAPPWIAIPGVSRVPNLLVHALNLRAHVDPNPYAAMPSMHLGYALLFTYYASRLDNRLRVLGYAVTAAMGFTVLYTGNHYLIDIAAGLLVAWASIRAADKLYPWVYERVSRLAARIGASLD